MYGVNAGGAASYKGRNIILQRCALESDKAPTSVETLSGRCQRAHSASGLPAHPDRAWRIRGAQWGSSPKAGTCVLELHELPGWSPEIGTSRI